MNYDPYNRQCGKSGWGIKTVYLILCVQIGLVVGVSEDFYNPDYTDESSHIFHSSGGIGADNLQDTTNANLLEKSKRHFGAIAALSGQKDRNQRETPSLLTVDSEMFKRHLGSFAATKAKQRGIDLSLIQKRYLGSLASKSGFRSPTSISMLRLPSTSFDSLLHEQNKRHVGAFAKINSKPFNRVAKLFGDTSEPVEEEDEGENIQEQFFDYPIDITEKIQAKEQLFDPDDEDEFLDQPVTTVKNKRFLGSLARVGWFPRQFRGIVAENPYDKRHIGSAARMGWVPLSKSDRFDDGGLGYGSGFKRNVQSLRKNHFNAPNALRRLRI